MPNSIYISDLDYMARYFPCTLYDYRDKEKSLMYYMRYALDRTQSMFRYENLPDTIPARDLELMLQTRGCVGIAPVDGKLYAFVGGLGGEPDPYYMPTIFTVANPALKYNANLRIHEEVVVIPNDSMYTGLLPLFSRYITQMIENDLSITMASINSRIQDFITAGDDRGKMAADRYLRDLEAGKLGAIADENFLRGIMFSPSGAARTSGTLTDLIELQQYLKASMFNEIGLDANYNMKRESLNSAESQMNNDALLPLADNMLETRRRALEEVNDLFGTEITVDFASSWKDNAEEIELLHESIVPESAEEAPAAEDEPETDNNEPEQEEEIE